MQTLRTAEKATPSHVAPDYPSKCIPVTFSLVHPDHCCSLHSPSTFLSQSFCTCYSLSLPCSSLFRLTPPFIQAPAPMPPLQIGCFCSPCLKQHPLIPFASYSAFLILETLSWPHITEYFIWGRLGEWLEKAMAPHSSTLAWKIPWTEEPGGLQSMGSLRVGHNWATSLSLFTFMHWRRKWQPTPMFLPGKSQGRGSLVGCHLWGRTESDTTEAT